MNNEEAHDLIEEVVTFQHRTYGYPRWATLLELELLLLNALAARERLIAMGYDHLTISVVQP